MQPAELDAHLSECERCRARSEALSRARALVATPVRPLGASERDHDIEAALDSAAPSRWIRSATWLTTAAALLLLLAVAGVLVFGLHHHNTTAPNDAAPAMSLRRTEPRLPVVGDLGTISSPEALSSKLATIVDSGPAPNQHLPSSAAATSKPRGTLSSRCDASASTLARSASPLYAYRVTYERVDAFVVVLAPIYASSPPPGSPPRTVDTRAAPRGWRAIVLAADGCRVLADLSI